MRNFIKIFMIFIVATLSFALVAKERTVYECVSPYGIASQKKFEHKGTCQHACAGHNRCDPVQIDDRSGWPVHNVGGYVGAEDFGSRPTDAFAFPEKDSARLVQDFDNLINLLEQRLPEPGQQQEPVVAANYYSANQLKSVPEQRK